MPLDAILLTALRRELENSLLGAKIDRISMPEKDVLILSVHSREQGSRRVLLSVRPGSARISFTEQTMENPAQPPMFCMLLRKYLLGARIAALEQPLGERLLLLRLDTVDELNCRGEKTLVLELMGKGLNLLLLDGDGRILTMRTPTGAPCCLAFFIRCRRSRKSRRFSGRKGRSSPGFLHVPTGCSRRISGFSIRSADSHRFCAGNCRSADGKVLQVRLTRCAHVSIPETLRRS